MLGRAFFALNVMNVGCWMNNFGSVGCWNIPFQGPKKGVKHVIQCFAPVNKVHVVRSHK